ncbi:SCO6745 family protein [Kribbella sp. C-35]|uniref:SCO6745 family protein n=1 Tax=Kribbella sp. C-35 TaxID=2789276 RepID=UPI00397CAB6F
MNRARRMWKVLEPYHAITYFSPETRKATDALGLKGGWMSYFGCRAAPLGPVGPEIVAAVFYNFHPAMVARSLPDAWSYATPAQLLEARLTAVDNAVRRLFPDSDVTRAAELGRRAAELAPVAGRPIAAANAALEWPDEPHLVLWQATTILRESRGDGHVAALVAAGLSPCQALVTLSAAGGPSKEVFQLNRRWSDEEWSAASADLQSRGLLDADGTLTESGRTLRQQVEDTTDSLADQGWQALGDELSTELHDLVRPLSAVLMSDGLIPPDNPMSMRWD